MKLETQMLRDSKQQHRRPPSRPHPHAPDAPAPAPPTPTPHPHPHPHPPPPQRDFEREGALRGGGGLVAPVQRVDDFLAGAGGRREGRARPREPWRDPRREPRRWGRRASGGARAAGCAPCGGGRLLSNQASSPAPPVPRPPGRTSDAGKLPSSSYRLGVRSAPLHDLYPPPLSAALRAALLRFERRLPGFANGGAGLLHGVETRTSAPVRIERRQGDCCSVSVEGLFPCGEGAGAAGGIVSAAVDGMRVGEAVVATLTGVRLGLCS
jgi:hypothetical protein